MLNFIAWGMPGPEELIVICVFGVIIFGKRLPEVGRSIGKSIVEFKKGLKGVDDEVDRQSSVPSPTIKVAPPVLPGASEQYKFDPVTGQPLQPSVAVPAGAKFDPFTGKPIGDEQTPGVESVGSVQ